MGGSLSYVLHTITVLYYKIITYIQNLKTFQIQLKYRKLKYQKTVDCSYYWTAAELIG